MGLCQPSKNYTVNLKAYSGGGSISKTIAECINLIKAVNSNYNLIFLDPYNYPYIIGGFALPANITDLYFVTDAKYTSYSNMVGARGESNGSSVNVLNTQMSMYCIYNDGTRLIGAGVGHNFSSTNLDGNNYRTASGDYQYPYILYCDRDDINIYINNNLQLPFVNATEEIYKIGTPSGLTDISKYNDDYPISSVAYNDWQSYVVPGDYIPIDSWTPQTIALKYGRIEFGSDGYGYINIRDNDGNIIAEQHGILTWLAGNKIYIIAGICEEEQRGRIGVFIEPPSGTATGVGWNSRSVDRKAYEFITQNKLGATVKVNYYIPEDTYQYCKLTYKKDKEPESVNDGTIINIDPTETDCLVEGLDEESKYYFTIYTDKSESNSYQFTVIPDPVPPEYKSFIDNINGTGFNWIKEIQQDTATITNSDHSTFTSNMYKYYPMNKVTWYTYHHQGTDVESWNKTTFGGLTTALFVSSKIDKVEINSNNGVYSCTITKNNQNTERDPNRMFVYDKTITMGGVYTDATLPRSWYANFYGHSDYLACTNCNPFYLAGSWATRTFTGTLTEVFTQLQRYVRNIDIYVDGELWSKAGK